MDIGDFFDSHREKPEPVTGPWDDDFEYIPDAYPIPETEWWKDWAWETHHMKLYGNLVEVPRRIIMFGGAYTYSGVSHPATPFPPELELIRQDIERRTGRLFNSCLCNLYRDGNDSVGWHSDADYEHRGQAWIASVSFGAVRRFRIKHRENTTQHHWDLEPGSLLIMKTFAQDNWKHQVPKTTKRVGPRLNLTFRHIV